MKKYSLVTPCVLLTSLLLSLLFLFSCKSDQASEKMELKAKIDSVEKNMVNSQMELNKELALQGINLYDQYVKSFPDDSLAPEYLFRVSDLSRAMNNIQKSMQSLQTICKKYPNYKKVPDCLFLQGYYMQEFVGDTAKAREYYKAFVSKYPDHPFADDARALINMLGKSNEQIIKEFEQQADSSKEHS